MLTRQSFIHAIWNGLKNIKTNVHICSVNKVVQKKNKFSNANKLPKQSIKFANIRISKEMRHYSSHRKHHSVSDDRKNVAFLLLISIYIYI